MDLLQAIENRHSVRSYTEKRIEGETLAELQQLVAQCNAEGRLNIQLCINEPDAFSGIMAKYGKFSNVRNYIALVGKKSSDLDEKCGYYGERLVLEAQCLGLNTCWVGASYRKGKAAVKLPDGQKLVMVIAIGYGQSPGSGHRVKPIEDLCIVNGPMPEWFRKGVEAAQLAPTAMNQQKFRFQLSGNNVRALTGVGFYTKLDLGIAKYHFELGAGMGGWHWVQ